MKKYQLTFDVPDDFEPEELSLTTEYKDTISISDEGFVPSVSEQIGKLIDEQVKVEWVTASDDGIIIFKFPIELAAYFDEIEQIKEKLENTTGKQVLGIVDSIDLMVSSPHDAINMLQAMIDKVRTRAAILQK